MAMVPFYTLFRDLALQEMRTLTIQGDTELPDGEYGFLELYCDDVDCDCQRVIVQVISRGTGREIWATIAYGWQSVEFYEERVGSTVLALQCQGPSLDPINIQSEYAPALLRWFEVALRDPPYVERLKRHYALFKGAIREKHRRRKPRRGRARPG
jgi:hypothetical protein